MTTLLVIVLIVVLIGSLPNWSYASQWGYGPSGLVGLILVILLVLYLTGHRF